MRTLRSAPPVGPNAITLGQRIYTPSAEADVLRQGADDIAFPHHSVDTEHWMWWQAPACGCTTRTRAVGRLQVASEHFSADLAGRLIMLPALSVPVFGLKPNPNIDLVHAHICASKAQRILGSKCGVYLSFPRSIHAISTNNRGRSLRDSDAPQHATQ